MMKLPIISQIACFSLLFCCFQASCAEKLPPSLEVKMPKGSINKNSYLSLEEIEKFVSKLVSKYPEHTKVEEIGRSIENRPINAFCFGACNKEGTAEVLYTAMHHSREPMSMMVLIYFLEYMDKKLDAGDLDVLSLITSRQMWFIFVVNPDGYQYNIAQQPWLANRAGQRKNRRNDSRSCRVDDKKGVDLNRNYQFCFDIDNKGSEDKPCEGDYRGAKAFSEPETQAVRDFVDQHDFSAAFNYHSFGKYFNIPYACKDKKQPNEKAYSIFKEMGAEFCKYNKYKFGQPWKESNLYSVNGEASDWMWNRRRIYAMSPEVGPEFNVGASEGFWPSNSDVLDKTGQELLYPNIYLAKFSGAMYNLTVVKSHAEKKKLTFDFKVTNLGLRKGGHLQFIGLSTSVMGARSKLITVHAKKVPTIEQRKKLMDSQSVPVSLKLTMLSKKPSNSSTYYVAMKDYSACFIYRISVIRGRTSVSKPVQMPICGACTSLFKIESTNSSDCELNKAIHNAVFKTMINSTQSNTTSQPVVSKIGTVKTNNINGTEFEATKKTKTVDDDQKRNLYNELLQELRNYEDNDDSGELEEDYLSSDQNNTNDDEAYEA